MRKADYSALAHIIRATLDHYSAKPENDNRHCTEATEAVQHIAQQFAQRASVDRAAFLKACGIE